MTTDLNCNHCRNRLDCIVQNGGCGIKFLSTPHVYESGEAGYLIKGGINTPEDCVFVPAVGSSLNLCCDQIHIPVDLKTLMCIKSIRSWKEYYHEEGIHTLFLNEHICLTAKEVE